MVLLVATLKVPFYIAGAVFVIWAVAISLIGINRANFVANATGQRTIILVSAVLAAVAIATAIVTA